MLTIFFVCATAVFGTAVAQRLFERSNAAPGPLQRWAGAGLCGLICALALSWILALLGLLTKPALLLSAIVLTAAGGLGLFRSRIGRPGSSGKRDMALRRLELLSLLPVVLWIAFSLYRGYRLPVGNFDALSYHLPKSVYLMLDHGYNYLELPDYRLNYPCNYELLLADSLILENSDRMTGPLSTVFFVLFLLFAAALAEQWWGRDLTVILFVTLLVAATPVLLLHSSAHKNDLMLCAAILSGFLWLGRWLASKAPFDLFLTVASFLIALGTKGQAVFAGFLALSTVTVVSLFSPPRDPRAILRKAGALLLLALLGGTLLGGIPYLMNLGVTGSPLAFPRNAVQQPGYGDWSNLWTFTVLLTIAPFSDLDSFVWVPWRGQHWLWPKYDLYFSNFGAQWLVALILLAALVSASRGRRSFVTIPRGSWVAAVIAAAAWLAMVPMRIRPVGHFAGFPRSMLFIVPVLVTVAGGPFLGSTSPLPILTTRIRDWLLAGAAVLFGVQAALCATFDVYEPITGLIKFGGTRLVYFTENHLYRRAATMLDEWAGENDVIAVDAGPFTWLYPLWGPHFTRRVQILAGREAEPIRKEVCWVIVDRGLGSEGWDDPRVRDMSEMLRRLNRGRPRPEELLVLKRMLKEPDFYMVHYDRVRNEAIFLRK